MGHDNHTCEVPAAATTTKRGRVVRSVKARFLVRTSSDSERSRRRELFGLADRRRRPG